MLKRFALLLAFLSIAAASGCGKREDKVVAKVGEREITIGQFEQAAESIKDVYLPLTDDLEGKRQLLDHMINKEVMTLKAIQAGYEKDPGFVNFWERYKGQYLVAAMENELVVEKVSVTEEEAKNYFDRMQYEYTLSQIVLPDENQAQMVREQLLGGADFEELAKKYSISPDAKDGGFVGPAQVGQMHYWVEEALFSLKEGDISQPLATSTGYAILKVHRIRKVTPEKDIEWAKQRVKAIKQKKMLEDLKKKIEKEIGLVIYPQAVDIVYNNLPPDIPFQDIIEYKVTYENAPKLEIPEQYLDMILAQYSDSTYTLRDYLKIYDAYPLPERPRRASGKGGVVESIHKYIWDKVLPVYAEEKLKIQNIPKVAKDLQRKKERFLVQTFYNDRIQKEVGVADPEIKAYYEEHRSEFLTPEKRDVGVIIVSSEDKAKEVASLARKGTDWNRLVRSYSEDPNARESAGRTGLHQQGDYEDYDAVAFSLKKGDVSDPFQVPRGWAVVKVFEIKPPEQISLADAALAIRNKLTAERSDELLKKKLEEWRKEFEITINEGNLKKAKLSRTKPPAEPPGQSK